MRLTTLKALECLVDRMCYLGVEFNLGNIPDVGDIKGELIEENEDYSPQETSIVIKVDWKKGDEILSQELYHSVKTDQVEKTAERLQTLKMSESLKEKLQRKRNIDSSWTLDDFRVMGRLIIAKDPINNDPTTKLHVKNINDGQKRTRRSIPRVAPTEVAPTEESDIGELDDSDSDEDGKKQETITYKRENQQRTCIVKLDVDNKDIKFNGFYFSITWKEKTKSTTYQQFIFLRCTKEEIDKEQDELHRFLRINEDFKGGFARFTEGTVKKGNLGSWDTTIKTSRQIEDKDNTAIEKPIYYIIDTKTIK